MQKKKFRGSVIRNADGTFTGLFKLKSKSVRRKPEESCSGFPTHDTAQRWANEAAARYAEWRERRKAARTRNRVRRRADEAWADSQPLSVLAQEILNQGPKKSVAKAGLWERVETMNLEAALQAAKDGDDADAAYRRAKRETGRNQQQILENALTGSLDILDGSQRAAAVQRAASIARCAELTRASMPGDTTLQGVHHPRSPLQTESSLKLN